MDGHAHKLRKALWRVGLTAVVLGSELLAAQGASYGTEQVSRIVNDFGTRVTRYLELRTQKAGGPPKSTKSTNELQNKEQDTRAKVQDARSNARQGDIFAPEIAEYFRHQIAATFNGPQGERIRASMRRAEPVHNLAIGVNQSYPDGVPLQSTPPSLLLNLPRLPQELEYRIVGHDLVLHDITANIVVDFVPNAVPET